MQRYRRLDKYKCEEFFFQNIIYFEYYFKNKMTFKIKRSHRSKTEWTHATETESISSVGFNIRIRLRMPISMSS